MSEHEEQVAPAAYSPYKPVVVDELIKALEARRTLGIQRYSVPLQPDNGRDMKRDLVEELLDALVYLQGLRLEEQSRCTCAQDALCKLCGTPWRRSHLCAPVPGQTP